MTMLSTAIIQGERLRLRQWTGTLLALVGLIYLVLPGLSAPDPLGAALMTCAGIAWGIYSLRGRSSSDPIGSTSGNFLRSVPMVLIAVPCPITALLKISSRFAIFKMQGEKDKCTQCQACMRSCPMDINITEYVKSGRRVP